MRGDFQPEALVHRSVPSPPAPVWGATISFPTDRCRTLITPAEREGRPGPDLMEALRSVPVRAATTPSTAGGTLAGSST